MNKYTEGNTTERHHLTHLAETLTDDELARPVGTAGWTVAGYFGHLAFWDQRALTLLRKWRTSPIGPSPIDVDVVNEALRLHCLAVSPRKMAQLAASCAEALDAEIDALAPERLTEVENYGKAVQLDRAVHRRHHLGQIEQALRRQNRRPSENRGREHATS